MTDNEITEIVGWPTLPQMEKFRAVAKAAAAKEREVCAEVCEAIQSKTNKWGPMAGYCAEQIRMQSNAPMQG